MYEITASLIIAIITYTPETSQAEAGVSTIKVGVLDYYGKMNVEEFLDWISSL